MQSVGAAAANPTMLALQIPRLLKGASLPVIFQSTSADPHTRLEDFTDLLRMHARSSPPPRTPSYWPYDQVVTECRRLRPRAMQAVS